MSTILSQLDIDVRWRDLDANQHVNNAMYLSYLEEARVVWLNQIIPDWQATGGVPVLAAVQLDFRRPIGYPARVRVRQQLNRLGRSSLTLGSLLLDAMDESRVYAEGEVVLVWANPLLGTAMPLPDALRVACESGAG
ncbi:MAG TPA: thioesterase family protein [Aquimonas sp.]|jgi:acyl-CoA thioester hydrolase|nr:acyl-CoA thioesterase [Xanthomonadales bacterium]HRD73704.1 thioesterase family protein [Aquimonas sp.]HRF54043.1 thioesterase family protein [Aquimonas sp.]